MLVVHVVILGDVPAGAQLLIFVFAVHVAGSQLEWGELRIIHSFVGIGFLDLVQIKTHVGWVIVIPILFVHTHTFFLFFFFFVGTSF